SADGRWRAPDETGCNCLRRLLGIVGCEATGGSANHRLRRQPFRCADGRDVGLSDAEWSSSHATPPRDSGARVQSPDASSRPGTRDLDGTRHSRAGRPGSPAHAMAAPLISEYWEASLPATAVGRGEAAFG